MSAWTVVGHVELSSAQPSITFNNIPQTGTDLLCLVSANTTSNDVNMQFDLNGGNGGGGRNLVGVGSGSAITQTQASGFFQWISSRINTANTFANGLIYITNYASTTQVKSILTDGVSEENSAAGYQIMTSALYNSTSAITSLNLRVQLDLNMLQYSSATLYTITKGSSGGVTVS